MRGHVRKRGQSWSIIYDERPDPATGERRQRERGGFPDRDAAETALAEAIATVKQGGYVTPADVTVSRFLTEWIERKAEDDLKPSTAKSYRTNIRRHLIPRLGALRVQELEVAHVEDALRLIHREGGRGGTPLSLRTVDYCRVVLAAALDDAVRRGIVRGNPARLARIPARERPDWTPRHAPQPPWTMDELRTFLRGAGADRLAAMWNLFVTTGIRRGEAAGLQWCDVDLEVGTVRVRRNRAVAEDADGRRLVYDDPEPKRDASKRTITLDAATVTAMKTHRTRQLEERLAAGVAWVEEDRVFCRHDGTGLDPDWITALFTELCEATGVRTIRLHDARHTHATRMLEAGVPIEVVSKRLGHARISVTLDMYVHPDDDQQRRGSDVFGDLLADGGEG